MGGGLAGTRARERVEQPSDESRRWLPEKAVIEALLVATVFGWLLYYIAADRQRIGWDAAVYMHCAREILAGKIPFRDIVDVNPPLVQFLHVPPALLAKITHAPASLVFNAWVLGCAVASVAAFDAVLRRIPSVDDERRFSLLLALAFSNHLAWLQGHWGQREHFVVLCWVPLLFVRWADYERVALQRTLHVAIAVSAALTLAIKPHYLLPALMFELVLATHYRRFPIARAEVLGFALVALGYAALFALLPAMRHAFFERYLPLFAKGYRNYDCSLRDLLAPQEVWLSCGCLVLSVSVQLARRRQLVITPAFTAFYAGSFAAYLLQHKGWPYQIFPSLALTPLLLMLLFELGPALRRTSLLVALCAGLDHEAHAPHGELLEEAWVRPLRSVVSSNTRDGDSVAMLVTGVVGPYPLMTQLGLRLGSRYPWLPLLPMFYPADGSYGCHYRHWGEGNRDEQQLLEDLRADFQKLHPDLIVMEAQEGRALRPGCSVAQWARASGLLERAMSNYVLLERVPGFDIWRREEAAQLRNSASARLVSNQ